LPGSVHSCTLLSTTKVSSATCRREVLSHPVCVAFYILHDFFDKIGGAIHNAYESHAPGLKFRIDYKMIFFYNTVDKLPEYPGRSS
jgi:hypothetical protein